MDKNIKLKKIFFLILLILFLSGCSISLPNRSGKGFEEISYKKGYNSLKLELKNFVDKVYVNDYTMLNLQLLNNGGYDINYGIIKLAVDQDYLEILGNPQKDFSLKGKSISSPEGESITISFTIKAKDIETLSLKQNANIYFTSCYNYQTELSLDVCIDSDIYNVQQKVCQPDIQKISGGQGSPLAISEVETKMVYDEERKVIVPTFLITLKDNGKGTVFRENYETSYCSPIGISQEDLNVINVDVSMNHNNGIYRLSCIPEGDIKLINKERKIICKNYDGFSLEEGTFKTPLKIKLSYGYADVLSKNIEINKLK